MKVFSASQIKAWDAYTIAHEPVFSIDLMERAAQKCTDWLLEHYGTQKQFVFFCGKGNNGGDGLAMARQLYQKGFDVAVYILEFGKMGSADFQQNLQRLNAFPVAITFIQSNEHFPPLKKDDLLIDALYGAGLNKPLAGLSADLVKHINAAEATVVSIDVPSGMFMDCSSLGNEIIKARHTLTFETYKLGLLLAENAPYMGNVVLLPIGLHKGFSAKEDAPYVFTELKAILTVLKERERFAHKGTYGHALLIGGSWGKTGAVVLAAKAALRTGCGLLTTHVPRSSYTILQTAVPEAMTLTDKAENFNTTLPDNLAKYNAIGVGPGLGTEEQTVEMVLQLLQNAESPLVLDADALNCLAKNKRHLKGLPPLSILTPHPKEAERLFGPCPNDFERLKQVQQQAKELNCIIVLKGHHTFIALPNGQGYFNSTGNAGMAKGGSGDVLTGILTSLLAQGYTPPEAAILGVYLHGLAGDVAASALCMEAMLPSDLVQFLPQAFAHLHQQLTKST